MRTTTETLRTQKGVNYLGVRLDCKLTYWTQNPHFAGKVSKITFELSRLMANTGGPKQKKTFYTDHTNLLYGAEL